MKIKLITDGLMPGGFQIIAESPEEDLILRNFANWEQYTHEKRPLRIANQGGKLNFSGYSITIDRRPTEEQGLCLNDK